MLQVLNYIQSGNCKLRHIFIAIFFLSGDYTDAKEIVRIKKPGNTLSKEARNKYHMHDAMLNQQSGKNYSV